MRDEAVGHASDSEWTFLKMDREEADMNMHDNYRLAKAQQERLRQMAQESGVPRRPGLFAALWKTFAEKLIGAERHRPVDSRTKEQQGGRTAVGRQ